MKRAILVVLGTGAVLGAMLAVLAWNYSGAGFHPLYLSNTDASAAVGCWRLFDGAWHPADKNRALWFAPAIAKLDTAAAQRSNQRRGRVYTASRLDSTGVPIDTGSRHVHNGGVWGVTAVSGTLWIEFQSGFGGPAFRLARPHRVKDADTLRGSAGEFADTDPYFQHEGHAYAVRVSCPASSAALPGTHSF